MGRRGYQGRETPPNAGGARRFTLGLGAHSLNPVSAPPRSDPRAGRLTGILAKRPAAGKVKTRLVPPLAPEQAAALAQAMLDDAVARGLAPEAGSRARLVYAPPEDEAWFRARYGTGIELAPQRGAGLAERLSAFFEDALAEPGLCTAVAVGADAPDVPARRLAEAHLALEGGADLVLGPDGGGGYYLVGLRAPEPRLFLDVAMSTPTMCAETVALARARGLAVVLLAPGQDVDVAGDLERLSAALSARPPGDPDLPRATHSVLRGLRLIA